MSGHGKKLARAAGLVSLATMLSRLLGLVRQQLFAALLGATMESDAFLIAFRIPNLLRDLFAEGALSQAFVPTFKKALVGDGKDDAYVLANRVAGSLFVLIGAIVLVAAVFAPQIVTVLDPKAATNPEELDLTVTLTRIMLPFLPVVSLAAVAMGMLNAQDRFGGPALAPATFNTVSIAVGLGLWASGADAHWVAIGWSIGTLAGGACQLGIQIPMLWKVGYRIRPRLDLALKDPRTRRIGRLMLPAVAGLAAVQVNIIVNTAFASSEVGANTFLTNAFRLLQLPIGVFGVAIATVSTTRYATAAATHDQESLRDHMVSGLRLVMFLTLPAAVGLIVLAHPIIRLIFQHGKFNASDAANTADALQLYAVGLVAYAAIKVVAPAFYALDRARVPLFGSLMAVAGNLILVIALHDRVGFRILALGIGCGAILNVATLYLFFHRRVIGLPGLSLLFYLLRAGAAAAAMGAAAWGCAGWLDDALGHDSITMRAVGTLVPVVVGAVSYAACCWILRIEELGHYAKRLRRR